MARLGHLSLVIQFVPGNMIANVGFFLVNGGVGRHAFA
jgi:hypothetical protein